MSASELEKLEDFLNSPYHNKNSVIIKLFSIVKKYYPEFNSQKLEKGKVYSKLYPGKKFNDQLFRNLISDSIKVFLNFLRIEHLTANKFIFAEALLAEANNRVLDTVFHKTVKTIQEEFFKHGNISSDYFNFKRTVENSLFSFEISKGNQEKTSEFIINLLDYGYYDYIIKLFDKYFDLRLNEYVFNKKYDIDKYEKIFHNIDFKNILAKLKETSDIDYKIFNIFYLIYKCISDLKDDESLYELKNIYKPNFNLFAKGTNVIISNRIESICILKGIHGKNEFIKEEFDIMKFAIENKIHKRENSFIDITRFRNIFNRGLSLGEVDWVENFISSHINELKEEFREDMQYYCKAMLSFHRKNYDESQDNLNKMKLNKFVFNLDYRRLMLMIYYEKSDFVSAKNLIESFKNFIYKNKNVSETRKKNLFRFINDINDLINAKEGNKNSFEELEIRLKKDEKIMNREWLIQKTSEIKY
ncbi:MAG TPA: hypothetical protein PLG90_00810 [Ignavibacteria bacterium]|nr:hypothetical protein [Ignavibacteria bacterium]